MLVKSLRVGHGMGDILGGESGGHAAQVGVNVRQGDEGAYIGAVAGENQG